MATGPDLAALFPSGTSTGTSGPSNASSGPDLNALFYKSSETAGKEVDSGQYRYKYAEEPAPAPEQSNFGRGWDVSGKQLKQTAYGTAALIGDTVGATGLREWGLKGYKDAEKEVRAISKESDSFTNAVQSGEIGKWLTYSSGYLLGQVAELGVASLAGAAVGTLAAGPAAPAGAVGGAVVGAIEKSAVQAGVKGFVAKMIDKEAVRLAATGMAEEAAAKAAVSSVYRTIGATTANTFLNATQELGSIYGDAVEEAARTGQEYSLGKVWLAGIAATAVDSWADSKAVGNFMNALGGSKSIKGIATEALKGGFREGMTEGVQTAIERWGADKTLTDKEAFKDYIDSAAVGFLGGSVGGASSAAVNKVTAKKDDQTAPPDQGDKSGGTTPPAAPPTAPAADIYAGSNQPTAPESGVKTEPVQQFSNRELRETLSNMDAVAYLYSQGDATEKQNIEKAIDRLGLRREFDATVGREQNIAAGEQILGNAPVFMEQLNTAIEGFANTPNQSTRVKRAPNPMPPSMADESLESMQQAADEYNSFKEAEKASKVSKRTKASELAQQIDEAAHEAATSPLNDKPQPTDAQKESGNYPKGHVRLHGMDIAIENPQGSTRSGVSPDGVAWQNAMQHHYGYIKGSLGKDKDHVDVFVGPNPESKTAFVVDQIDPKTGKFDEHKVMLGFNTKEEAEAGYRANYSQDWNGMGAISEMPVAALKSWAKDGFKNKPLAMTEKTAEALTAQTNDAPVQAQPNAVQEAKEGVKDALYNLWDVASDVSGTKMNITGKRYTAADLPGALQKVMESLVKLGYVKLKDISSVLIERMRNNENWKHLADQVTPFMLRQAYKKLNKFEGKEADADVEAIKGKELHDIIHKRQAKEKAEKTEVSRKEEENAPPEVDYGTYVSRPTQPRQEPAPARRVIRSGSDVALYIGKNWKMGDQKSINQRVERMNDEEFSKFEKAAGEFMERQRKRAAEKPAQSAEQKSLRAKVDSIMNMVNSRDSQFYRDTLTRLRAQIKSIDDSLAKGRSFEVNGKKFEAIDESDENAYLWTNWLNPDIVKDLPQDKLLAARREIQEDLNTIQSDYVRGMAKLFRRSMGRIESEVRAAKAEAIAAGMSEQEVNDIVEPALQSIQVMRDEMRGRNRKEAPVPQDQVEAVSEAMEFDKHKALSKLMSDLRTGKATDLEAVRYVSRGIKDGLFTQREVREAFGAHQRDLPEAMFPLSGQVAYNHRMTDYAKLSPNQSMAREEWLTSMDRVVKNVPDAMKGDMFTEAEKTAYGFWKERREALRDRRKTDLVMEGADDAKQAFEGLLFTKYSLDQMRHPEKITNERERAALTATVPDPVEAWFGDLEYALNKRPDLSNQLLNEDVTDIYPPDLKAFRAWRDRKLEGYKKEAEVTARLPYFQELMGMDGLPEDMFEKYRNQIATAQLVELDRIMASARDLNESIAEREMSAEEMESVLSDFMGQKINDEMVNGQTVEQYFGMDERGQKARDAKEVSIEDMSADEQANEAGTFDLTDEADENGDPSELRFSKQAAGIFTKNMTASQVMTHVARLTRGWKSAPAITVVPNVSALPEKLRSKVMERLGADMFAKGVFDPETGHVYLFSDHLASEADTEFTLFHEVYGHLGMRAFLGAKFDAFLNNMYRIYPGVREQVDERMQQEGMGKLEATEEVIANIAGQDRNPPVVKSWIGKVLAGLREIGFNRVADWMASLTDAELSYYLKGARDTAQNGDFATMNGAPGNIRLAEERMPYELFSTKGDKTTAYARFNPVTQTWAFFKAKGDDIRKGYTATVHDTYEEVLDAMRKSGKVERRKRSGLYFDDKIPTDFVNIADFTNISGMKRWMRDKITNLQNEYRPVFDVVEYLRSQGRINDRIDVKQALKLYEGKVASAMDHFNAHYVTPIMELVKEAGKAGASSEIINKYLIARHAEERNKQVKRVNPKMEHGSGMKPRTQDRSGYLDILEDVQKEPYFQTLEEIGRMTDKLSEQKIKYLLNTGMITWKMATAMSTAYKHYVNLSGVNGKLDQFDDPGAMTGGSKMNVKGKEQRAFGRGDEAPDVLARTIQGMEAAIIRGQKNLVAQKLLGMLEANYDPNFAVINEIAYKRMIGEDGMVMETEDPSYIQRKDVMVAKINGIPVTMRFKNTERGSFADAIHGMVYPRDSREWVNQIGWLNQKFGQMLTTWNPAWIAVNFARDVQTMFFNAAADGRITKGQAIQMTKLLMPSAKVALYMASKGKLNLNVDPELIRMYNEMQKHGGFTGFLNRHGLEQQVDRIAEALGEHSGKEKAFDKIEKVLSFMEYMSLPMEIAPRLAAYKVVREGGMTADQASVFAKEITVNFNMRGANRELRQLFLFYNPAIQGSAKLLSLFGEFTPDYKIQLKTKGVKYAAAWIGFGMMMNMIARAFSDDDKDGRNALDKVPTYKRATAAIFKVDTPGAAIPIPYGWNAFYAMGHFMYDYVNGHQSLGETLKRIGKSSAEAFSPMGTAGLDSQSGFGTVLKGITPTVGLPLVELFANENRYGGPIRMSNNFGGPELPDSQMAFRSASPISRGITQGLNSLTFGNTARSGWIDVNPSTIDHLIGGYLPGLFNEGYKAASMGLRAASGEELKNTPMPLIDRFTAKVPESFDSGSFRRAKGLLDTLYHEYELYPERRKELIAANPGMLAAHAKLSAINQEVRLLRSDLALMERPTSGYTKEQQIQKLNRLREREKDLYSRGVSAAIQAGPDIKAAIMASD